MSFYVGIRKGNITTLSMKKPFYSFNTVGIHVKEEVKPITSFLVQAMCYVFQLEKQLKKPPLGSCS